MATGTGKIPVKASPTPVGSSIPVEETPIQDQEPLELQPLAIISTIKKEDRVIPSWDDFVAIVGRDTIPNSEYYEKMSHIGRDYFISKDLEGEEPKFVFLTQTYIKTQLLEEDMEEEDLPSEVLIANIYLLHREIEKKIREMENGEAFLYMLRFVGQFKNKDDGKPTLNSVTTLSKKLVDKLDAKDEPTNKDLKKAWKKFDAIVHNKDSPVDILIYFDKENSISVVMLMDYFMRKFTQSETYDGDDDLDESGLRVIMAPIEERRIVIPIYIEESEEQMRPRQPEGTSAVGGQPISATQEEKNRM